MNNATPNENINQAPVQKIDSQNKSATVSRGLDKNTQAQVISQESLPGDMALDIASNPNSATNISKNTKDSAAGVAAAAENNSILAPQDQTTSSVFVENDIWKIRAVLDNKSPPVKPFPIPNNQLIELVFDHNILSENMMYLRGYITIGSKRLGELLTNNELQTEFVFRGDGKDELNLELNPSYEKSVLPEEIWFTKLDFIVYDVEDLPADKGHYKRIHFYHKPYHILKTRNLKISSAELLNIEDKQNLSNDERQIETGELLKQIFIKVGLEEYVDHDNWDVGSSTMFYNAGTNSSVLEEIQHILNFHISEKNQSPCILYYNRGINKFQLISLDSFFEQAGSTAEDPGKYQIEHFWINSENEGAEAVENLSPNRAPLIDSAQVYDKDIKQRNYSTISESSYNLFDMSGSDSSLSIITRPVYSRNFKNKKFNLSITQNEISKVKEHFKLSYTDKLFPGTKGDPLFILNKDKIDNESFFVGHAPITNKSENIGINYGRNFIVKSAVFLNLGINFPVPGSSHRHPGRFIGIEKRSFNIENKYDDKLLGQWFVTKIIYQWHRGEMKNYITAVKTHSYRNLKFKEDV